MRSTRTQLLVVLLATAVAAGIFLHRGPPPGMDVYDAVANQDSAEARRFLAWDIPGPMWRVTALDTPLHFQLEVARENEEMVALLAMRRDWLYCHATNGFVRGRPIVLVMRRGPETRTVRLVRILLDAGFGVNDDVYEDTGVTALHLAVMLDRLLVARVLLERGGDVNAIDHKGRTPLDCLLFDRTNGRTVELLRKHGAKTGEELRQEKGQDRGTQSQ